MSKTLLRLLAIVMAFSLIAAACGDDDDSTSSDDSTDEGTDNGTSEDNGDGELKIGYVLPQTGDLAPIIDALVKPLELAEQEITEAGGEFTLVPGDSGTDPAVASATVDGLIADGVDVIIGPAGTTVTLGVIDKITGSNILQCSGSTTGASLSTYPDNGYYFRTSPPDSLQGPALADVIIDDGAGSVVIMHRNDDYGAGFAGFLEEALTGAGVDVPEVIALDPDATSYDAEAGQAADAGADAVVVITFAEGATVMQSLIEVGAGPADTAIYVTDGFKDSVTPADIDPDDPTVLEGVRGTAPAAAPAAGEATFPERLEAFAPGTPTIFSAYFYDCMNIIVLASLEAGSDDPTQIVEHMATVTSGGTTCSSYAECAELIAAGEDIDYAGASGPVDLNENGEPNEGSYDVYEYDAEGTAVTETQVTFAN